MCWISEHGGRFAPGVRAEYLPKLDKGDQVVDRRTSRRLSRAIIGKIDSRATTIREDGRPHLYGKNREEFEWPTHCCDRGHDGRQIWPY